MARTLNPFAGTHEDYLDYQDALRQARGDADAQPQGPIIRWWDEASYIAYQANVPHPDDLAAELGQDRDPTPEEQAEMDAYEAEVKAREAAAAQAREDFWGDTPENLRF